METRLLHLRKLGEASSMSRISLRTALEHWQASLASQGLRDSTRHYYEHTGRLLADFCEQRGAVTVQAITTRLLDQFRASRPGLASTTSAKELVTLKVLCGYLLQRGYMESNPAAVIRAPKSRPADKTTYTAQEVIAILQAADTFTESVQARLRAKAAILLMLHTGMRISDVATLRRDEVIDGLLTRRTIKTGGLVRIKLPAEVLTALDFLPAGTDRFFWNGRSSPATAITAMESLLRRVYRHSGVAKAISHRWRHTLASNLAGQGVALETIADILGISPAVAQKHYRKFVPARQDRVNEAMASLQTRQPVIEQSKPY